MTEATGTGHGKVILLGEHAVVHGQPAIALSLRESLQVTLRPGGDATAPGSDLGRALGAAAEALGIEHPPLGVSVEGDLPIAVGLGSSAALAVGLVRGLAEMVDRTLSDADAGRLANEVEKLFHGTPSGIDATTAAHDGLLWFEAGPPARFEHVEPADSPPIVVALSGSRHHTASTVGSLGQRAARRPAVYRPIFAAVGELVRAGREALETADWPMLGELMSMNHALLRGCGVSTVDLDRLVEDALAEGALGAKLTGGGGGGAAIALAGGDPAALALRLQARGWTAFVA